MTSPLGDIVKALDKPNNSLNHYGDTLDYPTTAKKYQRSNYSNYLYHMQVLKCPSIQY